MVEINFAKLISLNRGYIEVTVSLKENFKLLQ